MKISKMFLCILLSVAMVATFIPMTSFAQDRSGQNPLDYIYSVDIDLTVPEPGTIVEGNYYYDCITNGVSYTKQTPQPVVTVPEDAEYELWTDVWNGNNTNYGMWYEEDGVTPFEGTMRPGCTYVASIYLKAKNPDNKWFNNTTSYPFTANVTGGTYWKYEEMGYWNDYEESIVRVYIKVTPQAKETIDEVNITLTPPFDGTVVEGTGFSGYDRQQPQPEVTVPAGAKYELEGNADMNNGIWVVDPFTREAFEGLIELSENAYFAMIYLQPKEKDGVYFSDNCKVNLNDEYMYVAEQGTFSFWDQNYNHLRVIIEVHAACNHKWNDGEVTTEPTCTETGVMTYTCTAGCNERRTEVIPAKGHTLKHVISKATLSKNGSEYDQCSVCNAKLSTKTIYAPKAFNLSATKYTYDGKVKKPAVTVKDANGKTIAASNYSVKYTSNKNIGKATAKITFKGKYTGTKSLTFNINPKGTTISKLTGKKKAFTVAWKKQATKTTGYQIQYSLSSKFASGNKLVTVGKTGTTSKTIRNLKAKKTYYVRVRTYKKVSGVKYYSAWSVKKYVKTK